MDINIAVTGRPCSGKTSLIACIYRAMDESMPGYFRLPETEDFDALTKALSDIEAKSSGNRPSFTSLLTGHEGEAWEYDLLLKSGNENIHFAIQENAENFEDTNVFIAVIDAPLLMSGNENISGVSEAVNTFTEALEGSNGNKLLLIVPVKCEGYTRRDWSAFITRVSASFSGLAELSRTKYRGRSAIAIIPVHTMGGASFEGFSYEDGNISGEKFRRDKNVNFRPEFADIVMRFAVSFLIHEGVIAGDAAMKIADNSGLNDERFEILSGHELLEPVKPKKPNHTMKIIAAAVIVIVLSGVGYYVMRRHNMMTQEAIAENTRQTEEALSRADQQSIEARNSEQSAITERDDAMKEAHTLLQEKLQALKRAERAEKLEERYKQQIKALQEELSRVKAELESVRQSKKERKKFLGIF